MTIEKSFAADPSFFHILQVPFLAGNPKAALRNIDSVTLSRSEALKLFGTTKVLGRTVTTMRGGEKRDLQVTGVFEDLPKNSHTDLRMVRRFNSAEEDNCPWGCVNGFVYAKLKPGVDVETINGQMQAWRNATCRRSM